MLGTNNRVYVWRKNDEKYNLHRICSRSERKISLMIWRCICCDGVGTLTAVEGNINSAKYQTTTGHTCTFLTEGKEIENTSWKVLAYGIYARVVDVSEIERVSAANE